jgi:trimethylamine--corrinoid protein Co-methyltransferase
MSNTQQTTSPADVRQPPPREGAQREGVLVTPECRLSPKQIDLIDGASRALLEDPGLLSYNAEAAELFKRAGAKVEDAGDCARIRIDEKILNRAIDSAPSTIVLGAREPDNRLVLDASEPRVRFGSGAETNVWLDVQFDGGTPRFDRQPGSIARLAESAHLCDQLEHLDFFIRNVNIQDKAVTSRNKDVNQFVTSLSHITKHVQAGLTDLEALDEVVQLGRIFAGGEEAFRAEPLLSFIACVIKSPLQVVEDTADKLMAIARSGVPLVISSCPMGGATGPFDEFGMVALINAELLAGVTLHQLAAPGSPVLYGAVPVRTRLDNLNDMYAAAEFVHYNMDCAQMARHYKLPCYSTAGVGDVSTPGIQATVEKMLTHLMVPRAGAQYIHYAFGLLERTNVFCPEQAVLDDAHIGLVKRTLVDPAIDEKTQAEVIAQVRDVMNSSHKTFMYNLPLPSRDNVYAQYPLEDAEGGALLAAQRRRLEMNETEKKLPSEDVRRDLAEHVPGLLPETRAVCGL